MVAMPDILNIEDSPEVAIEGHATSAALATFFGVVLCVAALGLWLVPGASFDPALMLIKLGLSIFLMIGGSMFLVAARRDTHPEVQLDSRRGILRVIERNDRGRVEDTFEVAYDDLSEVDFRDGMLIARDHHGQSILEVPVENAGDLDEIRAALGPAFSRAA
ncbi:hypothetical protein N4R57_12365 [Rhodobacteraceae bacterium D3-12]|nr:hypothetical protein N4R57_12365 [Rhodobacteraceae bacterium D3-12]